MNPFIHMGMKRWLLNLRDEIHRQGLGIRRNGAKIFKQTSLIAQLSLQKGMWHLLWEKTRPRNAQLECSQLVQSITEIRKWCLLCSANFHYML